jgi:hypothetical protein
MLTTVTKLPEYIRCANEVLNNEKSNITKSERNELAKLVGALVNVALEREHV